MCVYQIKYYSNTQSIIKTTKCKRKTNPNSSSEHYVLLRLCSAYPRAGYSSGNKASTRHTGHVRCSFNQQWIH